MAETTFLTQVGKIIIANTPGGVVATQVGKVVIARQSPASILATQAGKSVVGLRPVPKIQATATGETTISLSMWAADGATAHALHRSTTPGFTPGPATLIASYGATPAASLSDTGLLVGTTYYYALVATVGGEDYAAWALATTWGFPAPTLRVGYVGATTAVLFVDPDPDYLTVEFRTVQGAVIVDQIEQTGTNRNYRYLEGLTPSTAYISDARVRYAGGWSDWSDAVNWSTLAVDEVPELGCPPQFTYPHNPDGNAWDRIGRGFFSPLQGQPLSGSEAVIIFRWHVEAQWNFYLSDDAGASYAPIASSVGRYGDADDDRLVRHRALLDTTGYADGVDYRLKAISQNLDPQITWESMTFAIDNAAVIGWWKAPVTEYDRTTRFAKMWAQHNQRWTGAPQVQPPWVIWRDGCVAAYAGHDYALLANREVAESDGADATVRYYIWSGEGGLFRLQGRDDTEAIRAGLGFMAQGLDTDSRIGIFVGLYNPVTWPLGCCADYLTSITGQIEVRYSQVAGSGFGVGATSDDKVRKLYFKALTKPYQVTAEEVTIIGGIPTFPLPGDPTGGAYKYWGVMGYRAAIAPSSGIHWTQNSCARRWEMYSQRTRVELDPGDRTRFRVRVRIDGPGIDPPDSGYWHLDEWIQCDEEWDAGVTGLSSWQRALDLYGQPNGARVFASLSVLPLNPGELPELESEDLLPLYEPQEGEPCTVVLMIYEEDRQTVRWEVGTSALHANPFLLEPENYGEQEIDPVEGAATIGQAEYVIVDRRQVPGDQDTGWMTERLAVSSLGAIHGRRMRMLRYIDYQLGWVVIADGPSSTPRMDASYAAYRGVIRDTRETERKVRAFIQTDCWLLPMGVEDGWGSYTGPDGGTDWLVPPAEPLVGLFNHYSYGGFLRGRVTFDEDLSLVGDDYSVTEQIQTIQGVIDLATANGQPLGDPRPVFYEWPDIEIWWREHESGDPWTVIQPTDLVMPGEDNLLLRDPGAPADPAGATDDWYPARSLFGATAGFYSSGGGVYRNVYIPPEGGGDLDDGTPVTAVFYLYMMGYGAEGTFPDHNTRIEVAVRYTGEPTEATPKLISGLTPGELLKNLYDGVYSPRDPVTAAILPTAIRYHEPDLLLTGLPANPDDPDPGTPPQVLLRITEPVDDLRKWAEENVFAPLGWIPALDNDGRISPRTQVAPQDASGLTQITNAITEPAPEWDAGERIINILQLFYPRFYGVVPGEVKSIDRLAEREVIHEFRDEASITNHGEQKAALDAQAFAAIGDENGQPVMGLAAETGYALAQLRRLYVFDRYRNGAVTIQVPVRRDYVATLRAGDFVLIDLSWFPDYVTQQRGLLTSGQILAIHDVDCEWRILLIEEALPVTEES